MSLKKLFIILLSALAASTYAATTIVPYGNSAWVHGYTYDGKNTMKFSRSAFFFNKIKQYNEGAGPGHQLTELFVYAATIEISPAKNNQYLPNNFRLTYYPSRLMSKITDNWDDWVGQLDAGFNSVHAYSHLTVTGKAKAKRVLNIIDISGVVGYKGSHGTWYMNGLDQPSAMQLANVVAAQVCADDVVDGVSFDIEPFSFSNDSGVIQGYGQKYFYTQIAKDFAGHYSNGKKDPLHCVDGMHKQGRIFGIFTGGGAVQDNPSAIAKVLTQYGNGYLIFGLYDLGDNVVAGVAESPSAHAQEVQTAIASDMQLAEQYKIPYQFAIGAAATATQFERLGPTPTGYNQIDYVKADIAAINNSSARKDPLFKGIDLYAFNEELLVKDPNQTTVHLNRQYPPDIFSDTQKAVVPYLQNNL